MKLCLKCNKEHDGSFGSGKFCNRSCANSRVFTKESKLKKSEANKGLNKGKDTWNKGLNWVITKCLYCGDDIKCRKNYEKKYHPECWKKCSGGLRKGSGRGKSGWYKGYWCDSSYELVWIIYNLENNIPFERNTKKYLYIWDNKERVYIPDFIQDGNVIEIKGFVTEQTIAKMNSVQNLKILYREDLNKEFDYVINKYGKNFLKLYIAE
jgi:hypothetical protein